MALRPRRYKSIYDAKQKNRRKALAAIDGGANINYIYRSSEGETNTIWQIPFDHSKR